MNRAADYSPEEFAEWNEKMAQQYNPDEYHRSSNMIVRWVESRRTKCLLKQLRAEPHHHVLEVGVGAGNILEQIQSEHRYGIDLSRFLLDIAAKRLPDAQLVEGNAEALLDHYQHQQFDRIFCSEVLEHVQHPEVVIQQIAACLAPDGIAVVSVPNESIINKLKQILKTLGIFRLLFPNIADHMEDEWHVHEFSPELLRSITKPHMRLVAIKKVPFFWMPIRLVAVLQTRNS